jgi:hypothetical protein
MGRIARLSPVLDPATRTAPIEVEIPNDQYRLKPGMYARVGIITESHPNALVVPTNALVDAGGTRGVYLSVNNVAAFHPVKIGIEGNERTEILDGLADGDRVVTTGAAGLRNGDPIVLAGGNGGRGGGGRGGRGAGRGNRGGRGAANSVTPSVTAEQPRAPSSQPTTRENYGNFGGGARQASPGTRGSGPETGGSKPGSRIPGPGSEGRRGGRRGGQAPAGAPQAGPDTQ